MDSSPKTDRLLWVDIYKGVAVLWMIQGHISFLMTPAIRQGLGFKFLTFIHGIVTLSFFFTSGLLFLVNLKRKLNDFLNFGPLFWRQLSKLASIIILGYILHIPYFSLYKVITRSTSEDLKNFLQVDALQCIGVSILLLVILSLLLRNRARVALGASLLCGVFFFGAPFSWSYAQGLPLWLQGYFNGLSGSRFPLFPYGAFLLAGSVVGYLYDQAKTRGRDVDFIKWLFISGLAIIATNLSLHFPLKRVFTTLGWWHYYESAPTWFLIKLGIISVLVGGFWYWEKRQALKILTLILVVAGSESLLAYAGHLPLVFGSVLGGGIKGLVDTNLNWATYPLISLGLVTLMVGLCWLWREVKNFSHRLARWFLVLFWVHLIARFLLRPY